MRQVVLTAAICAPILAGCAPTLQTYQDSAPSGGRLRIGEYRAFTRARVGCPTISIPEATTIEAPTHGRIEITIGPGTKAPPYAICRGVRGQTLFLDYIARRGYRGPDTLVYRIRFEDGETHLVRKRIDVR